MNAIFMHGIFKTSILTLLLMALVGVAHGQQLKEKKAKVVAKVTDTKNIIKDVTQLVITWPDNRDRTKGSKILAVRTELGQVRIPISAIKKITKLPDVNHEIIYRSGLSLKGQIDAGSIDASTEVDVQGEVFTGKIHLAWSDVGEVEFNDTDEPHVEFSPPMGTKIIIKPLGGEPHELYGLLVYYTHMAPEVTHTGFAIMTTRYDVLHNEILGYIPLKTSSGYDVDVPLALLENVRFSKSKLCTTIDVSLVNGQNKRKSYSGVLGWSHREKEKQPEFRLLGCNKYGTWIVDMPTASTTTINVFPGSYPIDDSVSQYGILPASGGTIGGKPFALYWSGPGNIETTSHRDVYDVVLADKTSLALIKAAPLGISYKQDGVDICFPGWKGKMRKLAIVGDLKDDNANVTTAKIVFSLNTNTSSEVNAVLEGTPSGYDDMGCRCRVPWNNAKEIQWKGKADPSTSGDR